MYVKFQKLLMTGCRDMDKKHQKYPQNGVFPHLWPPKSFFQKSGSVTFVSLWCFNFMQKIWKNQWTVSEIFKDGPTDHGQGRLLRTPSGKPGVQNKGNQFFELGGFFSSTMEMNGSKQHPIVPFTLSIRFKDFSFDFVDLSHYPTWGTV